MTLDPWLGVASLAVMLVGALLRHVQMDARDRQRLRSLENRVKKLDGIDANGG